MEEFDYEGAIGKRFTVEPWVGIYGGEDGIVIGRNHEWLVVRLEESGRAEFHPEELGFWEEEAVPSKP